jgi:hypothetical protein
MSHTFSVLSLLELTNILLSELQLTWYTGPTCPRHVATNFPVSPSHIRTDLSNDADRSQRPSGEN